MTNDTTTLNGALRELGETLADNLVSMGVSNASADDGLTSLAGKVLNIPPSLTGVQLTTSVTCNVNNILISSSSATISGILSASYDDTSASNVDLSGFLQGATVEIYNGDTLLGICITDQNGEYTYTWTPNTNGNATIKAVFNGTDDYDDCFSTTQNVQIIDIDSISLTTDKPVLSYYDEDTATLTATVNDSNDNLIENVPVTFRIVGGAVIGTATTDSNGECSVSYESNNAGDLNIQCNVGNFSSQTLNIEDVFYYNSNTYSTTTNNTPILTELPSNFKLSWEFKIDTNVSGLFLNVGTDENHIALFGKNKVNSVSTVTFQNESLGISTSNQNGSLLTLGEWYDAELTYNEGLWTLIIDNVTINQTYTANLNYVGIRIEQNNSVKNIKVIEL